MREKYIKPVIASDMNIAGVIPAGLTMAIGAFTAGVMAGTQVKKMLSGRVGCEKVKNLVEAGAAI